jgi:hypothetical protein
MFALHRLKLTGSVVIAPLDSPVKCKQVRAIQQFETHLPEVQEVLVHNWLKGAIILRRIMKPPVKTTQHEGHIFLV